MALCTCYGDIVDAGVDEPGAGGHGLVGRDAGHGDGVGGDAVGEACPEGSLASQVARLHLLEDDSDTLLLFTVYSMDGRPG